MSGDNNNIGVQFRLFGIKINSEADIQVQINKQRSKIFYIHICI